MKGKKISLFGIFYFIFISLTFSNEIKPDYAPLPLGYKEYLMGLGLNEVKELLKEDSSFAYKGEADVSFRSRDSQYMITTAGGLFIDSASFQFNSEKLYLIILNLNQETIDFYGVQQSLSHKYGDPTSLSPEGMVWENDSISIRLEYPLTLKYMDTQVFNSKIEDSKAYKGVKEMGRERFLSEF